MNRRIQIVPFTEIAADSLAVRQLRQIFFDASGKTFGDDTERQTFEYLWLGQFLEHEPNLAHVAVREDQVIGYIVASHVDPAQNHRFAALHYFQDFAEFTLRYPAQLHVNLSEASRGRGIGRQLIDRVLADAAAAGLEGVHVVTAVQARNRSFYERQGFFEMAKSVSRGRDVVFLVRPCKPD